MEKGIPNGVHSNHDRNGHRSTTLPAKQIKTDPSQEKQRKASMAVIPSPAPAAVRIPKSTDPNRFNDLPDEVPHITQGFVPLSKLLTRLAQKTHNDLEDTIMEVSNMPMPRPAPPGVDDESPENLQRKLRWLEFGQKAHATWVKALIITHWSRDAEDISKLIDLKNHLVNQSEQFHHVFNNLLTHKREYIWAKVPAPDLKTAHQVLSQGTFPIFPDLGFKDPRPLTAAQKDECLRNLEAMLSLRINLQDHDTIPFHFRSPVIHDGRVTFRVDNEFEVDLTVADDDMTKQYWVVDLRLLFKPQPPEWTSAMKTAMEHHLDHVLANEGLEGCYKTVHEFVLTLKISEYLRQAKHLQEDQSAGSLTTERLNRAASIQYWADRYKDSRKSWIVLGVAGNKKNAEAAKTAGFGAGHDDIPRAYHNKVTSGLMVQWARDGCEVKDPCITLNPAKVSAADLLRTVVGKHIEHLLSTIHTKISQKPRFANRDASVVLHISQTDPAESYLELGLDDFKNLQVRINPTTGFFVLQPATRITTVFEKNLNASTRDASTRDATNEAVLCLENIRAAQFNEDMRRQSHTSSWSPPMPSPIQKDELRAVTNFRDAVRSWVRHSSWDPRWFIMTALSLQGDRWYLMDIMDKKSGGAPNSFAKANTIKAHILLPIYTEYTGISSQFLDDLVEFGTAMMAHLSDSNYLRENKIPNNLTSELSIWSSFSHAVIPVARVKLSRFQSPNRKPYMRDWVEGCVSLVFRDLQGGTFQPDTHALLSTTSLQVVVEARLTVRNNARFRFLQSHLDPDVSYDNREGVLSVRIRSVDGETVTRSISSRLYAVERLVALVEAVQKSGGTVRCETVSLEKIVLVYSEKPLVSLDSPPSPPIPSGPRLSMADQQPPPQYHVTIDLTAPDAVNLVMERGNPHQRVQEHLATIANDPGRFNSLPVWLATTVSMHRAINASQESWGMAQKLQKGRLRVDCHRLDHIVTTFGLRQQKNRTIRFDLASTLHTSRTGFWWKVEISEASQSLKDITRKAFEAAAAQDPNIRASGAGVIARPESIETVFSTFDAVLFPLIDMKPRGQSVSLTGPGAGRGPGRGIGGNMGPGSGPPAPAPGTPGGRGAGTAMAAPVPSPSQGAMRQTMAAQAPMAPMMVNQGIGSGGGRGGRGGGQQARPMSIGGRGTATQQVVILD